MRAFNAFRYVSRYTFEIRNGSTSRAFSCFNSQTCFPVSPTTRSLADLLMEHYHSQQKHEFIEQDLEMLRNNRICTLQDWSLLSESRKAKYPDALASFLDGECEKLSTGAIPQQQQMRTDFISKRLLLDRLESEKRTVSRIATLLIEEIQEKADELVRELEGVKYHLDLNGISDKDSTISFDTINSVMKNNNDGTSSSIKSGKSKLSSRQLSYKLKMSLGSHGSARGEFNHPYGVVTDSQGNIIVTDKGNHRIQVFDNEGNFLRTFGSQGHGDAELYYPQGLAIDESDNIYVCDFRNHRIQVFNTYGRLIRKFGTQGTGDGQLILPSDIAVDDQGTVFVCDYFNNRVQKFGGDGQYISHIDTSAAETKPCAISVRKNGNTLVSDRDAHKLFEYDREGKQVGTIGSEGSGDAQFLNPEGIAIDHTTNLMYVCDADNHRIQIVDSDGRCVAKVGSEDEDVLYFPTRISLDCQSGDILVADMFKHKVYIFSKEC